jgi:hypothetical protein
MGGLFELSGFRWTEKQFRQIVTVPGTSSIAVPYCVSRTMKNCVLVADWLVKLTVFCWTEEQFCHTVYTRTRMYCSTLVYVRVRLFGYE